MSEVRTQGELGSALLKHTPRARGMKPLRLTENLLRRRDRTEALELLALLARLGVDPYVHRDDATLAGGLAVHVADGLRLGVDAPIAATELRVELALIFGAAGIVAEAAHHELLDERVCSVRVEVAGVELLRALLVAVDLFGQRDRPADAVGLDALVVRTLEALRLAYDELVVALAEDFEGY